MKSCTKCKISKTGKDFSKDRTRPDGLQYTCKKCKSDHAISTRKLFPLKTRDYGKNYYAKWNKLNPEKVSRYQKKFGKQRWVKEPEKMFARQQLQQAIRNKTLYRRNSCEICLNGPTHGHHEDYRKPLDVIWLCARCHSKLHLQYKEQGIKIPS